MRKILKSRLVVNIILTIIQITNLFVGNIIIHEVTSGLKFEWIKLLNNKIFLGVVAVLLIYNIISSFLIRNEKEEDQAIVAAIQKKKIELIDSLDVKHKYSQKETFKLLNKLDKIRRW